ncbi:hypothetical protein CPB86DRAFT_783546, partial [Serendipita vermifera]
MEANDAIQGSNETQGSAFYRVPVEILYRILHHATTSSLFPYLDDGSLSHSILHNPYLYGAYENGPVYLMPYFDHATYANQQRRITSLRQVCRQWNDIIKHYIAPKYQWIFTDDGTFIYPRPSQHPHLIILDCDRKPSSIVANLIPNRYELIGNDVQSPFKLPDKDLSQVKIGVFGLVLSFNVRDFPSRFPSLQSLTISLWGNGFRLLLRMPALMEQLTHLSLVWFTILPFASVGDRVLCFPNLRYLSIHFDSTFLSGSSAPELFPKWQLERLSCLSIAGRVPVEAEETFNTFFDHLSMGSRVTEVLFDFIWPQDDPRSNTFWGKMWTKWFPDLNILGVPWEIIDTVTSSLLSMRSSMKTSTRPSLRLFLLLNDAFGRPRPSTKNHHRFSDALGHAYRAGYLERVYIPEPEVRTLFVQDLVQYCLLRDIPVYDVEGWQVYKSTPPAGCVLPAPKKPFVRTAHPYMDPSYL